MNLLKLFYTKMKLIQLLTFLLEGHKGGEKGVAYLQSHLVVCMKIWDTIYVQHTFVFISYRQQRCKKFLGKIMEQFPLATILWAGLKGRKIQSESKIALAHNPLWTWNGNISPSTLFHLYQVQLMIEVTLLFFQPRLCSEIDLMLFQHFFFF